MMHGNLCIQAAVSAGHKEDIVTDYILKVYDLMYMFNLRPKVFFGPRISLMFVPYLKYVPIIKGVSTWTNEHLMPLICHQTVILSVGDTSGTCVMYE